MIVTYLANEIIIDNADKSLYPPTLKLWRAGHFILLMQLR